MRLLAALLLAAAALAGCATSSGPIAGCFALAASTAGAHPCDFRPVAGVEGVGP